MGTPGSRVNVRGAARDGRPGRAAAADSLSSRGGCSAPGLFRSCNVRASRRHPTARHRTAPWMRARETSDVSRGVDCRHREHRRRRRDGDPARRFGERRHRPDPASPCPPHRAARHRRRPPRRRPRDVGAVRDLRAEGGRHDLDRDGRVVRSSHDLPAGRHDRCAGWRDDRRSEHGRWRPEPDPGRRRAGPGPHGRGHSGADAPACAVPRRDSRTHPRPDPGADESAASDPSPAGDATAAASDIRARTESHDGSDASAASVAPPTAAPDARSDTRSAGSAGTDSRADAGPDGGSHASAATGSHPGSDGDARPRPASLDLRRRDLHPVGRSRDPQGP